MTDPGDNIQSIICPLFTAADESPNGIAAVAGNTSLTFRQYELLTRHYAEMFRAVEPGENHHMLFHEGNRLELPAALIACWRVNVVAVLLNRRYPFTAILNEYGFQGNVSRIFFTGDNEAAGLDKLAGIELDRWPDISVATGRTLPQIDLDQPATIMMTSGSSGRPKLVVHCYGNHYYSALGSNDNIPVTTGDRWLLSLPLYHVGGLAIVFRCLIGRGTIVIAQPGDNLTDLIEHHEITHVSLVATQLERLVDSLEKSRRSLPLKCVLLGGGPTPQPLIDRANVLGLPIYCSYGLTEMASQVVTTTSPGGRTREVLPYRDINVSGSGEILVRGKTRFLGYFENGKLRQPFTHDGWFPTGDRGAMSEDGLTVLGRIDSMWVSGGENVHPEEIERVLLAIDGIDNAIVVPVVDPEFGKRPVAFVQGSYETDSLTSALREKLPGYLVPIAFLSLPEDHTSTGLKPDRAALTRLADQLLAGRDCSH